MSWRIVLAVAALAFLAWVGFEIGRAGSDVQYARSAGPDTLIKGTVQGKRIDRRAWSLDYDTLTMSPDGTLLTIAHVRDGRIHRLGKPDVLMHADGVTVNTVTNDLTVSGAVTFTEDEGGGRKRTFQSTGALYNGFSRTLTLNHPSKITDSGATVTVARMTINFRTGDSSFGRIEGVK
jgi:lipopolysaccharide export system protein LptC